jgi:hypothetical protein
LFWPYTLSWSSKRDHKNPLVLPVKQELKQFQHWYNLLFFLFNCRLFDSEVIETTSLNNFATFMLVFLKQEMKIYCGIFKDSKLKKNRREKKRLWWKCKALVVWRVHLPTACSGRQLKLHVVLQAATQK